MKEFHAASGLSQTVLNGINIEIERGAFFCVVGPSGCGKTTLLNIIAGFESSSSGGVYYDDTPLSGPGTDRAVIFQDVSNALFPWLSAIENVEYGSRMRSLEKRERRARAMKYLELVGLAGDARKFSFELSGGMKQRVQIARALANDPDVLLMDEPFAAVDAINKQLLQEELTRIWQSTRTTVFYITHDIGEALRLGTQIAVMSRGPSATVLREFAIDRPRPRSTTEPEFQELQKTIETLIRQEVNAKRARG
jgi:NitT/TauT family transport system ATP-binding protein